MAGTATVMTRLENVVAVDQEKEMEELVVANGVDINTIQQYGCSLLMIAAQNDAIECTRKLIQLGADVDKLSEGWTAFMYACENGADDVAIVLVEAGASYHIPPSDGACKALKVSAAVVNAIAEREKRAHTAAAKGVEVPKENWLCMFLTNNGVPEEVAKDCEQCLLSEGFYTPHILATLPVHKFQSDYLADIGIEGRGLQYLLLTLHEELHDKRNRKKEPLWTQELEEAAQMVKKRARD